MKHGTVRVMATKAERRAARERVSAYHESQLNGLLGHVGAEIDRYRAGEIDAYAADETIHHYHRAAAELWKFCFARGGGAHVEFIAGLSRPHDRRRRNHRVVGTRRTATTPMTEPRCAPRAGCRGLSGRGHASRRLSALTAGQSWRYTGQSKITENLRGPGSGVGWSVPCYGGVAFRMIGRSGLRRATTWKPHPAKTEAIPV